MKFVVGMVGIAVGYAVLYYGMDLFKHYVPDGPAASTGIPLSVLLGLPFKTKPANGVAAPESFARPPFQYGGSGTP